MEGRTIILMGVASIIVRPLMRDAWRIAHSAPDFSRVKQPFQFLRRSTRDITVVQQWTRGLVDVYQTYLQPSASMDR
jgi:hypothetical protein